MWCPRSVSDCPVVPSCLVVNAWTKLAPDVAAVSFERSNSRSREGSQLRRHGNFDWTTSSVDCGHSGNMGYLLDSGKPRSMSRFACLQQTLEDLPRKLDWKILQNLENHIFSPPFLSGVNALTCDAIGQSCVRLLPHRVHCCFACYGWAWNLWPYCNIFGLSTNASFDPTLEEQVLAAWHPILAMLQVSIPL